MGLGRVKIPAIGAGGVVLAAAVLGVGAMGMGSIEVDAGIAGADAPVSRYEFERLANRVDMATWVLGVGGVGLGGVAIQRRKSAGGSGGGG